MTDYLGPLVIAEGFSAKHRHRGRVPLQAGTKLSRRHWETASPIGRLSELNDRLSVSVNSDGGRVLQIRN
jgi:hypothetical protein